jgi:hypothetical protein
MPLLQYAQRKKQIRSAVVDPIVGYWNAMGSYRDADVERFQRVAIPEVRAGQIAVARLTAAHLADEGKPIALMSREEIAAVRNVDPVVEYRRPAVSLYSTLAEGGSFADGVAVGAGRLTDLLTTDLQLASTHQAQRSLEAGGYAYYVRTLSGSRNCALCSIASTQRYWVGDLMPIHPGCDCGVDKVPADFDPGQVIDADGLDRTHGMVQEFAGISDSGGRAPDYRKLLVTREHGEYGPTLAWLDDSFTGPSGV